MPENESSSTLWRTILGVRFFAGHADEAVRLGLAGGLVVVPAAPALVNLGTDAEYTRALTTADLALTDSGLMVMLWNLLERDRVIRTSGLEYLVLMLKNPGFEQGRGTVWIMPGETACAKACTWLASQGIAIARDDCYLAPIYGPGRIDDPALARFLENKKPRQVVVALGGGTQERLGLFIRENVATATGIHCIGAALGFLSGDQVRIPMWADALVLGWLFRCLSAPGKFLPRYLVALRLIPLMIKQRHASCSGGL